MMKVRLVIIVGSIVLLILGVIIFLSTTGRYIYSNRQEARETLSSRPDILNQAGQEEAKGSLSAAISLYKQLINDFPNSPQVGDWQKKVGDLNIKLLFSPTIAEGSILYEIKQGDSLAKIAKKFNTTVELLKKSNNFSDDKIIVGRKIKVWTRPFNIVVDKSQNTLMLKIDDEVIKNYIVATGINNSTPIGNFKIINKLVNPPWYKPGASAPIPYGNPENILGTRWMGFNITTYGIHGTTDNETLGKQITQGCVRMSNSNVEELFTIVPVSTEVTIVD